MTHPCITPMIGILDDADRPEAKLLVVVWGSPRRRFFEYIHRTTPRAAPRNAFRGDRFTPAADFGVHLSFTRDGDLLVEKVAPSRARYADMVPRRWQGADSARIPLRSQLAGPVLRGVKAANAAELQQTLARMDEARDSRPRDAAHG